MFLKYKKQANGTSMTLKKEHFKFFFKEASIFLFYNTFLFKMIKKILFSSKLKLRRKKKKKY